MRLAWCNLENCVDGTFEKFFYSFLLEQEFLRFLQTHLFMEWVDLVNIVHFGLRLCSDHLSNIAIRKLKRLPLLRRHKITLNKSQHQTLYHPIILFDQFSHPLPISILTHHFFWDRYLCKNDFTQLSQKYRFLFFWRLFESLAGEWQGQVRFGLCVVGGRI